MVLTREQIEELFASDPAAGEEPGLEDLDRWFEQARAEEAALAAAEQADWDELATDELVARLMRP